MFSQNDFKILKKKGDGVLTMHVGILFSLHLPDDPAREMFLEGEKRKILHAENIVLAPAKGIFKNMLYGTQVFYLK